MNYEQALRMAHKELQNYMKKNLIALVLVTRSRLIQTSIPMNSFSHELVELVSRQYK